jgi:hypothetical protein
MSAPILPLGEIAAVAKKTREDALKAIWNQDAPNGQLYVCTDCGATASLGGNASFHAQQTQHAVPRLWQPVPTPVDQLRLELDPELLNAAGLSDPGDDESADLPLRAIIEAANERKFGSYLTIDYRHANRYVNLRGGSKPVLHRTLRNARSNLRYVAEGTEDSYDQVVLLLDLTCLPVVLPEAIPYEGKAGWSDAAFAERQAEMWAVRAERLMKERS